MKSSNKELVKKFIHNAGIDTVLQSMIEIMDENIDATDYDIESIRNPNDIWKFKMIEGLEHAYESYLEQFNNELIGENHET